MMRDRSIVGRDDMWAIAAARSAAAALPAFV